MDHIRINYLQSLNADEFCIHGRADAQKYSGNCYVLKTLLDIAIHKGQLSLAKDLARKCIETKKIPKQIIPSLVRQLVSLTMIHEALFLSQIIYKKSNESDEFLALLHYVAIHASDFEVARVTQAKLMDYYRVKKLPSMHETPRTHLLWCDDIKINQLVIDGFVNQVHSSYEKKILNIHNVDSRKFKVGYISSDYRNHPTSQLVKGLIREHNRHEFEIYCYDTGYDDKSSMRGEILGYFDHVRTIQNLDEQRAVDIVKADQLDILVDLNGLTTLSKIGFLKHRLAPIQISYLGFPATVGGRFIDYLIADQYVIPDEHLAYYKEKIIRIKKTYQVNDYDLDISFENNKRNDYGFTDDAFILGMFNNANKISESAWIVWLEILKKLPFAQLWMLQPNLVAQKNLIAMAQAKDVDVRKIIFTGHMPREKHFARIAVCDLLLDPWPYGGHTTTSDALYVGVPVVAKQGNNFASRVSGSLLKAAGLGGWIVPDEDAYIRAVCDLYENRTQIKKAKQYLQEHKTKLNIFNTKIKVQQIELAYKKIISNRLNGLQDQHINIGY